MHPRYDLGPDTFVLKLVTGSLDRVKGKLPLPGQGHLSIDWERDEHGVRWRLETTRPITLLTDDTRTPGMKRKVDDRLEMHFPVTSHRSQCPSVRQFLGSLGQQLDLKC